MDLKRFFLMRRKHKEDRRAILDLLFISVFGGGVYFLALRYELAEELFIFAARHERWQLDELVLLAMVLSVSLAIFALRRWLDLKKQIEIANTDSLTRVYNRRRINQLIKEEIDKTAKDKLPVSIIMFDLDDFKQVNDRFGHNTGDEVLKELAEVISASVRATDHLGRWGGEEFAILAPETDLEGARALAEKVRRRLEKYDFSVIGKMTASFGVAQYKEGDNAISFIHRADSQLYVAKKIGKNKVCAEDNP